MVAAVRSFSTAEDENQDRTGRERMAEEKDACLPVAGSWPGLCRLCGLGTVGTPV